MKTIHSDFDWVETSNGQIPNGALQGGIDVEKEPIYIGRFGIEGSGATIGGVISYV